jgi:hypothetical protein
MSQRMRREWTKEEVHRLKLLADGKVSADYIAKLLKRSITSVKAKAVFGPAAEGEGEVAALPRKFWTPEEDDRLRMLVEAGKQSNLSPSS